MLKKINGTAVEFDFEKTREYYTKNTVCDCCDCRNYRRFAGEKFPNLGAFLAQFGVDISRADETGSVYDEKRDVIEYLFAAYSIAGRVIEADDENIIITEKNAKLEITINNDYYPNEQEGEFFSIAVSGIELPWLLEGEYPDKAKK